MNTTWRSEIAKAMEYHGEEFSDAVGSNPEMDGEWLDEVFDDGFGGREGCSFTLWTARRVYFPAIYDGAEWVASVPRLVGGEATQHVGGGA